MIDGYVISIFGQRGAGKSTLMNQIIKPLERVILFDYLETRAENAKKMGFVKICNIDALISKIKLNYGIGFKVWYQPPEEQKDQEKALSKLSYALWDMQKRQLKKTGSVPMITLAIDEMSLVFPVTKLPDDIRGFNLLLTGGRHYGFNIIGASQRPAQVSTEFRSAAEVKYFLQLSEPRDLDVVGNTAGKETIEKVKNLKKLEFLRYQMGKISTGKTSFL